MISRILTAAVALTGVLLVACYPVQEPPPRRTHAHATPAPPPPAAPAAQEPLPTPDDPPSISGTKPLNPPNPPAIAPSPHPVPPPTPLKAKAPVTPKPDNPVAQKAPGRDGFVLSPYTNKLILVRGIPSGTTVPDQTCPPAEKKYFVVP